MTSCAGGPLARDPRVRVVPRKDVLYVYSRRGTDEVRGRSVERLHRRLEPYLDGRYSEEELVAAVTPSHAGAVRSLLGRLRESGALFPLEPEASAKGRHGEGAGGDRSRGVSIIEDRAREVRLILEARHLPLPADRPVLAFLDAGRAARWLLSIRDERDLPARWTCIVIVPDRDGPADETELRLRAESARWLLGTVFDPAPGARGTRVFRFSASEGALVDLARLTGEESGPDLFDSLAAQLGLVRAADCDQLPLVVLTPSQALFPSATTYFGLRFEEVRLRAAGDCLLAAGQEPATSRGGPVGSWEDAPGPSGVSKAAVEAILAERRILAGDLPASGWERVDLLSLETEHPDIEYLQSVLRLRKRACPVERTVGPRRTVILRSPEGAPWSASPLPHKAIADCLLAAVFEEFYAPRDDQAAALAVSDPLRFAAPDEWERVLRARAADPGAARWSSEPALRPISIWGRELWWGGGAP